MHPNGLRIAAVVGGAAAVWYSSSSAGGGVEWMRQGLSVAWQRAFHARPVLAESPLRPRPPVHPIYALHGTTQQSLIPAHTVDAILREAQHRRIAALSADSSSTNSTAGHSPVALVDAAALASNDPIEDRHSLHRFNRTTDSTTSTATDTSTTSTDSTTSTTSTWVVGMYDGHAGHQCSDVLASHLPHYIAKAISNTRSDDAASMQKALRTAFESMDADLLSVATHPDVNSRPYAVLPMFAGAVALVSVIVDQELYVASAGDVRAVLATLDSERKPKTLPLSTDHNLRNPVERKRLLAEHPNEPESVLCHRNRILGRLEPSRAFGDYRYKLDADRLKAINDSFNLHNPTLQNELIRSQPMPESKSPPYVTASPDITHHHITPNDQFLIIATDGLWDRLSNEEAVAIVSKYMTNPPDGDTAATYLIRESLSRDPRKPKPQTHLEKFNVLSSILSVPPPYSRMVRDDITVTVVFFKDAAETFQHAWTSVDGVKVMMDDRVSNRTWLDAVLAQIPPSKL